MHRKHKVYLVGVSFAFFILLMSTTTLGATTPITNLSETKLPQPQAANSLALIPPPPGMISYWEFNDGSGITAVDSIGRNDGRLMDGGAWVSGIAGTALDLAPHAFVDCGGDPSLSIDILLTIEAWVMLPDTRGIRTIVQNGDNPDNKMYHFAIEDGFLYFDRYDRSTSPANILRSHLRVNYGTWHHVAVVMDTNTREVTFYVNGTMDIHPGWNDPYAGLPYSRFSIGYGQDPMTGHSPTFFNGLIDEVAVYDAILTPDDIQMHYRNGLVGLGYLDEAPPPEIEAVDDAYATDEDVMLNVAAPGILANDIGVGITAVLETGPSSGSLALYGDGSFEYTPDPDFNGVDTFSYSVTDGIVVSNIATVTITVNAINDAPVAFDDFYTTDEDTELSTYGASLAGVLGNDYDVDGDLLEVVLVQDVTHGHLGLDSEGNFVYMPGSDFFGFDTFTYYVYDGSESSSTVMVTIEVLPINDAPVGVDDDYAIDEDTSLDLAAPGLLANDYDMDGDAITLVVITVPSHGSGSIGADGSFSYTPHPDWYGVDSMTYQVFDGVDYSGIVTVTITVNSVNDAPVAVDDYAVTDEDTPIIIDFLGNDYDVDDAFALQYVAWGSGIHGQLDVIPNYEVEPGVFRYVARYTPDPDWYGTTSAISYGIRDTFDAQASAQIIITVNPVNDAPVAVDDYVITDEDTPIIIDFMANDYDVDGDDFDWRVVGWNNIDLHGVAELVFDYEVEPGVFRTVLRYIPDLNWHGSTSTIYYVIGDSSNAQSSTAHIHITVNSVNDAPVAVDDNVVTDEDTPIIIDFLGNDYDVDDTFVLQYAAWGSGIHGELEFLPDYEVEPGVFRYVALYTPDLDWYGTTSAISYGIRDTFGAQASAQIIITVNPVNDAPVAVDDNIVTDEDTPIIIDFLGNDYDVDDSFTFDYATWGSGIHGELEFLQDYEVEPGVFRWVARYTPDPDWHGTTSAIVYGIRDAFGAQASAQIIITVNSVNDAPVAVDDNVVTDEDTPIIIDFLGNDYDVDDTFVLQYAAWGSGIHGELEFLPDYEVEPGVFRYVALYTPDPDWHGTTSAISYGIRDTFGAQTSAQIIITVNPVNDAPVAVDDYFVIDEDTSVIIDFMVNDYDVDDTFDWSYVQWNPIEINGELELVHNYEVSPGVFRTVLRYTPAPDWHGSSSSINYGIRDSFGEQSTAQIFLTVTSVNDAPVAVDDNIATDEDTAIIIDFMGNDHDVDDTFGWAYVAWSPIEINGELELVYDYEVEPGVFRDVIRYTPDPDWYGTTSAISYGIRDTFGAESNAQVFITVNSVNDAPVAVDDYVVTDEDTPIIIDFMGNDYDVDDTFDWAHVQWNPTEINGELELVHNYEASPGVFRTVLRYTPDVNWHGSCSSIQYSIRDTFDAQSSTATIYITVNSVNDAPVAVDDYVVTDENTPVIIDFMANDYDIEGDSFDWAWMGYSGVDLHGEIDFQQIEVEPGVFRTVVVYTPELNWYGTTSTLRYAIRDSLGADSLTAWIHITVNPVNDPPLANDDAYSTEAGVPIVVEAPGVLTNDVDIDGDSLEALLIDMPMHGTVALNSDGSFTYTPDVAYCGVDAFTYYAFDGLEYSNIALVTITVVDVTPPVTTIQFTGLEGEYDWYYSDVEVMLSANDDCSGVASTMYSLNGSTWMLYTDSFVLEDPGEHTIHYYSTDNAGNVEDIKTSTIKISKYTRSYVRGSGKIAEEDGGRGYFSFYVKFRMGGYLRGYATYLFRVPGYRYMVWSTDWLGMAIDGNHALLEVKCSIKQYNYETRERVWLTDFILRIEIWDNGKGKSDVFQIRIFDESGELFHEAGFDPPGNLLCGNIRIVTRKWKCWCNDWW
jgi:hypothetical protein